MNAQAPFEKTEPAPDKELDSEAEELQREREMPNTKIVSKRKNLEGKHATYAGLRTMPPGSFERRRFIKNGQPAIQFVCKFRGCSRAPFDKSTSMIVHYWRHLNVRPFKCDLCDACFTQSGTLFRHQKSVHSIENIKPRVIKHVESIQLFSVSRLDQKEEKPRDLLPHDFQQAYMIGPKDRSTSYHEQSFPCVTDAA